MGLTKKWMIQLHEQEYLEIPFELRQRFISEKVIYDDYEIYKHDPEFRKLYKAKKKATEDLDKWKFRKRHEQ